MGVAGKLSSNGGGISNCPWPHGGILHMENGEGIKG
jgi:hypothetical protein